MHSDLTPGVQRGRWLVQRIRALQAQGARADQAQLRAWQKELRQLVATLPALEVEQILTGLDASVSQPPHGHSLN